MTLELHADVRAEVPPALLPALLGEAPREPGRPHVSGDLPSVFQNGPMFRRAVSGYDRFQVDTYVRWAEDELATADREREHLEARQLRIRAELEHARRLLAHSAAGGQFLDASGRIGSMLAAAADEAEEVRAEAHAVRSAASAEAAGMLVNAKQAIAGARADARATVDAAAAEADAILAGAAQVAADAERSRQDAHAHARAVRAEAHAALKHAHADAAQVRRQAAEEAGAARAQVRREVLEILDAGRGQRRRADDEAAAVRDRLAADAGAMFAAVLTEVKALRRRRSSLRSEIRSLERRRTALEAEVGALADRLSRTTASGPAAALARLRERLSRSGSPRTL